MKNESYYTADGRFRFVYNKDGSLAFILDCSKLSKRPTGFD